MSVLTQLVYDYSKHWSFKKMENLDKFLQNNEDNEELSESDIEKLKKLKQGGPNGSIIRFFSNSADLQCALGHNPDKKRYSLVFRGSEGILDWLYDLIVVKTKLADNIYVHKGFYDQLTKNNTFDNIRNTVEEEISKNPDHTWFVSGHSAGSALSSLSSYFLSQLFPNVKWTVIALASPRVGNKHFKTRI
jgi:hypothetical protein